MPVLDGRFSSAVHGHELVFPSAWEIKILDDIVLANAPSASSLLRSNPGSRAGVSAIGVPHEGHAPVDWAQGAVHVLTNTLSAEPPTIIDSEVDLGEKGYEVTYRHFTDDIERTVTMRWTENAQFMIIVNAHSRGADELRQSLVDGVTYFPPTSQMSALASQGQTSRESIEVNTAVQREIGGDAAESINRFRVSAIAGATYRARVLGNSTDEFSLSVTDVDGCILGELQNELRFLDLENITWTAARTGEHFLDVTAKSAGAVYILTIKQLTAPEEITSGCL